MGSLQEIMATISEITQSFLDLKKKAEETKKFQVGSLPQYCNEEYFKINDLTKNELVSLKEKLDSLKKESEPFSQYVTTAGFNKLLIMIKNELLKRLAADIGFTQEEFIKEIRELERLKTLEREREHRKLFENM